MGSNTAEEMKKALNQSLSGFKKLSTINKRLPAFRELRLSKPILREPTSGLEPLTCSLRVIHQALQGLAQGCKSRISKGFSCPWLALCCTVMRSRWCQSGVKR
jgi:hypothetical protein